MSSHILYGEVLKLALERYLSARDSVEMFRCAKAMYSILPRDFRIRVTDLLGKFSDKIIVEPLDLKKKLLELEKSKTRQDEVRQFKKKYELARDEFEAEKLMTCIIDVLTDEELIAIPGGGGVEGVEIEGVVDEEEGEE